MKPLLSILIPTVVGREEKCNRLIQSIGKQQKFFKGETFNADSSFSPEVKSMFNEFVHVEKFKDNKEIAIGEKRELMYKKSTALFSWQIDDDDDISDNAIELILEAIKSNPDVDVISFEEYCNMDGKEYKSNHSGQYSGWEGDGNSVFPDGFHFHRTIFFKDVIRTELAKSVPVPHLRWSEDFEWAKLLKPLIQSEVHISEQLYRYIHVSSNPQERYGLDK